MPPAISQLKVEKSRRITIWPNWDSRPPIGCPSQGIDMQYLNHRRHTALLALLASLAPLPCSMAAAQDRPALQFGIGASSLHLDDIDFTAITDFFVTEVQDHQTNHDGDFTGYKLTGDLTGLMPHHRGEWLSTMAVRGFFSRFEDSQQTRCAFTADTDCAFFPLFDPDPTGNVSPGGSGAGGIFSDWHTTVDREATYWGAAVEMNLSREAAAPASFKDAPASLKDAPVAAEPAPFQWRAGLAVRRLDQKSSLFSEDLGFFEDPVTLQENLDATYYGGYIGFTSWKPLSNGFRLKLSGETGLYYANADYQGAYSSSASLGDGSPVAQSVTLSDTAPAFIGSLNLALERDLGPVTLGLFGEAEWISYVPKVLYNDTDLNGGVPFDIVGTQNGTALGDGSALSYTVGARVSIPIH